jgi:two-component system, NtrC family, sensor kinase
VGDSNVEQVCASLKFLSGAFTDVVDLLECWQHVWDTAKRGPIPPSLIEAARTALDEVDVPRLRREIPEAMTRALSGIEQIGAQLRRAREPAGALAGKRGPVDVREVVEAAATVARAQRLQTVDVETHVADGLPPLVACRSDLERALLLLLDRAAQAVAAVAAKRDGGRGRVAITAEKSGDLLRLVVEDDGREIAPERCETLFDAAAHDGPANPLAEVAEIVRDRHGGRILFESGTGHGTRIHLLLPLAPVAAPVAAPKPAAKR